MSTSLYVPSPARTIVYTGWLTTPLNAVPVPMNWPSKNPADVLDFSVDFSAWLADTDDDLIVAATLTPATTVRGDINIAYPLIVTSQMITAWLSYGQAGGTYEIEFSVNTFIGRTATFSVLLNVLNVLPNPTPPGSPPVAVAWQINFGRMDFRVPVNAVYIPVML
jgi:hypothetical protein